MKRNGVSRYATGGGRARVTNPQRRPKNRGRVFSREGSRRAKAREGSKGFFRAKAREGSKALSIFKTEISKTPFQKNEIAFWKFLLVFTEPA